MQSSRETHRKTLMQRLDRYESPSVSTVITERLKVHNDMYLHLTRKETKRQQT